MCVVYSATSEVLGMCDRSERFHTRFMRICEIRVWSPSNTLSADWAICKCKSLSANTSSLSLINVTAVPTSSFKENGEHSSLRSPFSIWLHKKSSAQYVIMVWCCHTHLKSITSVSIVCKCLLVCSIRFTYACCSWLRGVLLSMLPATHIPCNGVPVMMVI